MNARHRLSPTDRPTPRRTYGAHSGVGGPRVDARRLGFERCEARALLAAIAPVTNTLSDPFRRAVQLEVVWDSNQDSIINDGSSHCSGAMISARHVLTAAHCLYDSEEGGYADWVFAHAARDSEDNRPYGEARGLEWIVPGAYQSTEGSAHDMAIIALDRSLGDHTGWFGYTSFESQITPLITFPPNYTGLFDETLDIFQYPSKHSYNGSNLDGFEQYTSAIQLTQHISGSGPFGPWDEPFILAVNHDAAWTAKGSSGSPLVLRDSRQVIGVLSGGDDVPLGAGGTDTWVMINGPFRGSSTSTTWISDQIAALRPTLADRPVLTDHDQWFGTSVSSISDTTPHTGQSVTINARIFNGGTAAAANARVRFRLSTDVRYDTSDTLLGDADIASLPAFTSRTATLTTKLPELNLGTRYIVWTTDPSNTVTENEPQLHNSRVTTRADHRNGALRVTVSDDSYEQNDTRGTASPLAKGVWLSSLTGPGVQYDDDWYSINVTGSDRRVTANLTFTHADGDIDLQLVDSTGIVLASAASSDNNETLESLVPAAGTYYFRVHYGDRGNPYDLRWDASAVPDIVPVSLNVEQAEAFAGDTVSARFEVRNSGSGTADEFDVKFYLSRDSSVNTSDVYLGSRTISNLAAGATTVGNMGLKLPSGSSTFWQGNATYYIGMVIDPDNKLLEASESNNRSGTLAIDYDSIAVKVFPPGVREYAMATSNTISVPRFDSTLGTLNRAVVSVIVQPFLTNSSSNHMPAIAHVVVINVGPFTLVGTAPPVGGTIPIAHTHPVVGMGSGREFTSAADLAVFSLARTWNFPTAATTTDGFHTLPASGYQVLTTTRFEFTPPPPDLVPVSLAVTGETFYARETVEVPYAIRNAGAGPAGAFNAQWFISQDGVIDPANDVLLTTVAFPTGLSVGETRNGTARLQLPHPGTSFWRGDGRYYVGMVLDREQNVAESNESNNRNRGLGIDVAEIRVAVNRPGEFGVVGGGGPDRREICRIQSRFG